MSGHFRTAICQRTLLPAWQPVTKLWILLFCQKPPADEARRRSISSTDLRLRSNKVAGPFLTKPFGLRSFGLLPCPYLASCSNPKFFSAALFIVFNGLPGGQHRPCAASAATNATDHGTLTTPAQLRLTKNLLPGIAETLNPQLTLHQPSSARFLYWLACEVQNSGLIAS